MLGVLFSLGASVQPMRGSDSVVWTIKFRNGNTKRFKFPIRTTPEGSIDPYANKPKSNMDDIDKPGFFTTDTEFPGDRSQLIRL